ncbi:hypothetical protein ARMSODRAFT_1026650 [Armillaria solidipes]|uniref:Uncharacterized protein n=1 Tax=Armillaria solidipes TaxID=1076256 RepID=A0A2H3AZL4_9AGAR|nr:hypothetical protein ARMSODRAFT_1026650 [Armillaria solidipes]
MNLFLGVCWEYESTTSLEFNSIDDLDKLLRAINQNEVHHASEATVGTIGILSYDTWIHSACPILISGTCKRETGDEHLKLLEVTINAVEKQRSHTRICTVSITSDGKSKRGHALAMFTMKKQLSPSSLIYSQLHSFQFMNLLVGDDDLMCNKDYKHLFKRL